MPNFSGNSNKNKSSSSSSSIWFDITRVSKMSLATVLVLALAVTGSEAEVSQPDGAIARPSSRAATAFVPRLGKRFDRVTGPLERILCDGSLECARLALLDTLIRDISSSSSRFYPATSSSSSPPQAAYLLASPGALGELEEQREGVSLLDLVASRQSLPRREARASQGSSELVGMDGDDSSPASKRVAFTPRIGR